MEPTKPSSTGTWRCALSGIPQSQIRQCSSWKSLYGYGKAIERKRNRECHTRVRILPANSSSEWSVTFVFYEHDCLIFCPILHFLSLAFADTAFDSECIQCVEDIYRHTIPEFKESTLLKWKESWLTRPVFRRARVAGSGLATSATKALPYNSFVSQTKALGQGAGFRADLNPYAFRRGAAQVVNSEVFHFTNR